MKENGRERGRKLVEQIYAERERRDEPRRPNSLRPSELGHECTRRLWYRFRWADKMETFEGRMLRLFERGQLEEENFVKELKWVGAEVHDVDPDNPTQQIPVSIFDGHSNGYLDGVAGEVPFAKEEWVCCEFKTHNDKSFKQLDKDGVERSKPTHYAQMQLYMHEMQLSEGLYLAVNKNDDSLYAEFVPYNKSYAERLKQKAERIIYKQHIPPRINEQSTFYVCKMCSAADICHKYERPVRSCRTCMHATPAKERMKQNGRIVATWHCNLHDRILDLDAQRSGCDEHRYHSAMVDGGEGNGPDEHEEQTGVFWYEYVLPDGSTYTDKGPSGDR